MHDTYAPMTSIPAGALVDEPLQPDYLAGPAGFADADVATGILRPPGASAERGASVAIVEHESGRSWTFAELDAETSRVANALSSLGLRAGERVAFRSANRAEGIICALATWRAGGVVVPTPLQARGPELAFLLNDTGARFLVTQGDEQSLLAVEEAIAGGPTEHVIVFAGEQERFHSWERLVTDAAERFDGPPVDPDAVAIIWHTGGTTGVPKACYHTHRRFLLAGHALGQATGIEAGERWAAAAPIGHALGFIHHTNYTLLHGAAIVLVEGFQRPATVLEAIERDAVDTFTAIAATWAAMKDALEADPTLPLPTRLRRAFAMWQSASSSSVYDWWNERGIELLNNFGSTSFATWVLVPRRGEAFPAGALGRAAPGYEVIAIDPDADGIVPCPAGTPGRMAVRGPSGLTYWNRPDLQARDVRDGWTLVDDLIEIGPDGNAVYLGRTDYLISTAGYKVSPVEVESVLGAHDAVREVSVMGTADPIRHEVVTAFVALVDGSEGDDELKRELQDLVKRELAPYKYPRRVEFVERLPRDSVGKVRQGELRQLVERQAAPAATAPRAD
jgi:2-aminobenzoate-CoA ligase